MYTQPLLEFSVLTNFCDFQDRILSDMFGLTKLSKIKEQERRKAH